MTRASIPEARVSGSSCSNIGTCQASPRRWGTGRTGADLFLLRARSRGIETGNEYSGPDIPGAGWRPEGHDLVVGAAGVGLGHMMPHQIDPDPLHLAVVRGCVEYLLDRYEPADESADAELLSEHAAVAYSAGRAHGLAGAVELLLYEGERAGDAELLGAAAKWARLLATRAESPAQRVPTPRSVSMSVSWCRGLPGIAQTLLHAGEVLDDPDLAALACRLADVCLAFLPYVVVPFQCCGLNGIGNLFVDLAVRDAGERYWDAARATAEQMLLRAAGTESHPQFVVEAPEDRSAS